MSYAIISLGGKQYRVQQGEWLVVDRVKTEPGKTFKPDVLFANGEVGANGVTVTAKVVEHSLGPKIRIGKYKAKSGYKRHNGYRSRVSKIEIEAIGAAKKAPAKKTEAAAAKKPAAPKKKAATT
jgi:large subunit ribosomal protein L21